MNCRLTGVLLGTAVGDALGLPAEGLSPRRRRRLLPGPWRHRLVFGRGMVSDDTEHTLFVGQSLLENARDLRGFQRRLARRLRWWFASLPAGCGRATARACIKLWFGIPPSRSGVFSAGNGPAMRSELIGAYFHDQPSLLEQFVRASTELTHSDPKALVGALTVARFAVWTVARQPQVPPDVDTVGGLIANSAPPDDIEWQKYVACLLRCYGEQRSVIEFAANVGLERGVSGYIYHTVPVAVYAWLRHFVDFRTTLTAALDCGGDADTVGAIAGALAGATVGEPGIPQEWLDGIMDSPRSVQLLRDVANRLAAQSNDCDHRGAVPYFWPGVIPRNLFFFTVVLFHVFRRLAPPY